MVLSSLQKYSLMLVGGYIRLERGVPMKGSKCNNSYLELQEDRKIVKCKPDNQLCGYQFFCPNLGHYINSDRYIDCNKYVEMEEI